MKNSKKLLNVFFLGAFFSSTDVFALDLNQAKKIATKAQAYAEGKSWKISVAIVNAEGTLVYFQRADSAYSGSVVVSQKKAISSAKFNRPTSAFAASLLTNSRPDLLTVDDIVAVAGGVPIVEGGVLVGAIGVSGATSAQDEEVANAALAPDSAQ